MILTIDTGGTKTRLVTFGDTGEIAHEITFDTPHDTDQYIAELKRFIDSDFQREQISAVAIAVPGFVENNIVRWHMRLGWRDFDIPAALQDFLPDVPIWVQNDANTGALGVIARLDKPVARGVYLTLSTGIGAGFVINNRISLALENAEIGHMMIERGGQLAEWESFASGQAFYEQAGGKFGAEVFDTQIWQRYAYDVTLGLLVMIPFFHPEVIAIGGSMGTHFAKYGDFLRQYVAQFLPPVFAVPEIVPAAHPEYIVSYGALIYAERQLAG
jgi:predicted NBD/HSP70 family sugar kinase